MLSILTCLYYSEISLHSPFEEGAVTPLAQRLLSESGAAEVTYEQSLELYATEYSRILLALADLKKKTATTIATN